MQAQGMAVDADVLSAASSLSTSQSQLNQLDAGIEQIRKMLCSFTGYDEAANPVFGEVPSADPSYIATVNVTEDKEKAVNNNYNLISHQKPDRRRNDRSANPYLKDYHTDCKINCEM